MRIKSILISIVIAATAGMWCACNDDLDLGVNDAKLEKVEGFRISKFTTDRLNWLLTTAPTYASYSIRTPTTRCMNSA